VEVGTAAGRAAGIRDSRSPERGHLAVSAETFGALVGAVKRAANWTFVDRLGIVRGLGRRWPGTLTLRPRVRRFWRTLGVCSNLPDQAVSAKRKIVEIRLLRLLRSQA
jgi:hypothetical protein